MLPHGNALVAQSRRKRPAPPHMVGRTTHGEALHVSAISSTDTSSLEQRMEKRAARCDALHRARCRRMGSAQRLRNNVPSCRKSRPRASSPPRHASFGAIAALRHARRLTWSQPVAACSVRHARNPLSHATPHANRAQANAPHPANPTQKTRSPLSLRAQPPNRKRNGRLPF